jgi:hypothetical protein
MKPALLLLLVAAAAKPAAGRKLFDGKTLAGWERGQAKWSADAAAGELVGRSPPSDKNDFICTTEEFADFELKVTFKIEGNEKRNSGVQIRSKRIPGSHEVSGYQADAGKNYWGALYDESRRDKVLVAPSEEVRAKAVRAEDWNTYVIRADGRHITLTLNGVQTVDYTEPDPSIAGKGSICLQLHASSAALTVRFKDFVLTPLSRR